MSDVGAVTSFYGRWAGLYDVVARRTPRIGSVRARTADALGLSSGDTVVEMGCGTGANLPYLRERVGPAGRVVGVDVTPGMLARARRRAEREGWENVHLARGDAARPPIDGPVDAVLATFVVGMFDDPSAVVGTWCDLVPDGRIALLDAAPSGRPGTRPIDVLFRAFVVLSTPPTLRFRYPDPPHERLDARVRAAREALRNRAASVEHEERALGFLRLTAGRIG